MPRVHTSKFDDAASEQVVEYISTIISKKVQVYAQKVNQGETDEADCPQIPFTNPLQSTTSSDFLGFDKRYQPRPPRAAIVPAKTA